MSKTAFVTGSTGFVGHNLIEQLVGQGWSVIALHRASSDLSQLKRFKGVQRVVGDVTQKDSLKGLIPRHVDCVFHVAGDTSLWNRTHVEQMRTNVRGTRNVVRSALEVGARRFVHTSSIMAYGLHGGTITEETPTRGTASEINYIRTKALAEREVRKGISLGLKAVIINPSNTIGPYDTDNWARMFDMIQKGRLPAIPGGGGSFCHVRDVALAHIAAAEKGRVGHNYLLGGASSSYLGLAREINRILGLQRRIISAPRPILEGYARVEEWVAPLFGRRPDFTMDAVSLLSTNFYCTSKKAEKELGYRPQPLETMLRDCHDWLQKNKAQKKR